MKNKKIAIIGHFGGPENILDGQTIKTKILYEELETLTNWKIKQVDTYYKNKKPIKLLVESLITLIQYRDVIVLLSGNGMKFYFPILYFFSKLLGTNVYHDVIGGNLDTYINNNPKFKKYLISFKKNWVETENLKKRLEAQGVFNCEVIPNFKRLNVSITDNTDFSEPFKFCIFSRVMKEKGVEIAIDAVQSINNDSGREVCRLDIFGRIDEEYKSRFEEVLSRTTPAITYKGTVPYDRSVEAIKNYYALLFPTYWMGEGFPGTIVDAFSAGLPVIASDWNCNAEIVQNEYNGVLYPNKKVENLKEAILYIISQKENIFKLKNNCISTAMNYQPDDYIKIICDEIGG